MKDYDHIIIWLDYFDSNISRAKGRRIPTNKAVKSPTLEELKKAVERLGYTPEIVKAHHPKRSQIVSGYISIDRKDKKTKVIYELAESLKTIRGEIRQQN